MDLLQMNKILVPGPISRPKEEAWDGPGNQLLGRGRGLFHPVGSTVAWHDRTTSQH
jgi:hypothetical protein